MKACGERNATRSGPIVIVNHLSTVEKPTVVGSVSLSADKIDYRSCDLLSTGLRTHVPHLT